MTSHDIPLECKRKPRSRARPGLRLSCGAAFLFVLFAAFVPDPTAAVPGTATAIVLPPAAAIVAASTPAAPAKAPRILILCSGNRLLPANVLFDESLREALASDGSQFLECDAEFLDEARFPDGYDERMRDFVLRKYGGRRPGVIVAFGQPSLDFYLRHCGELFADAPVVFAGWGGEALSSVQQAHVTGVRAVFDAGATLRLALRLHPRTRQIFLISGAAPSDSARAAWDSLRPSGSRVALLWIDQPRAGLPEVLSRLPANSAVLEIAAFGATGDTTTRRLSAASSAPIYGTLDPLVARGYVGAFATPVDEIGRATAALVLKVLSLPEGSPLPPLRDLAPRPLLDWREMRRWGARKSQVPPGSLIRYKPPSFWRQHLLLVITTVTFILLQSGLILALVLQSRRRHRAEVEARRRREDLAHMMRVATMGELTASLAHEINQPLAAILSNAQAAQRLMAHGDSRREEVLEILADIAADDQRAGEVIRRMRTLLRKEGANLVDLDVNEVVDEVAGLVRGEMLQQGVALSLELSPTPCSVHGDKVQLQQVMLNLVMNALDAMKESTGGDRRIVVRSSVSGKAVEVSVHDAGAGVPADKVEHIFEPFVTTKANGIGLGLAICRSTIETHGGRIGITNNEDRGATFWFSLPAVEKVRS